MLETFQGKKLNWHYINLDVRPDRKEHAEAEFARLGIKAHRFRAYLPTDWRDDEDEVARMRNGTTPGAIGCYMSQLTLMQSCQLDEVIAICEDDICLADDIGERLAYVEEYLPDDWDVFYLGATFHSPGVWYQDPECSSWAHLGRDAEPTSAKRIIRTYGEWGTYAYFVNGAKSQKVAKALRDNCHNSRGIDHNFIQLGDKINSYCFVPGMAKQYDNQSNIGSGITKFSDFQHSLGPYWWADSMNDFDPEQFDWR